MSWDDIIDSMAEAQRTAEAAQLKAPF